MTATWETYKGALREHPLMQPVLQASGDARFTMSLLDMIDAYCKSPGVRGGDVIDSCRMVAGTLADMGWTLKENTGDGGAPWPSRDPQIR